MIWPILIFTLDERAFRIAWRACAILRDVRAVPAAVVVATDDDDEAFMPRRCGAELARW
jgi:hypothetical protein